MLPCAPTRVCYRLKNCGLCVVYIQKARATPLVLAWQSEKQQNKLVERTEAFVDTLIIYIDIAAFRVFLM